MIDKNELNYAIESAKIYHEFTMDSILNRLVNSTNTYVNRVDNLQLDYHLKMVGSAYNSFRSLELNKTMVDKASQAISTYSDSTFNMITRIPDENEITEIRPKAIIGYINMIEKGLSDITKGKVDNKKEKKLTSFDSIMEDLGPDLFDGDISFFRDRCRYNVTAIARTDSARSKSINADTINFYIIPWIYNFGDTSKKIGDLVKDYRFTIDYIRTTVPRILNMAADLREKGVATNMNNNRYGQFSIKATSNLLNIISFLTVIVMRKINTTTELMNKYTEICRCFLEYTNKETVIAKEDASLGDEYIPAASWYKCINGDLTDIIKSCEDIIDFYSQYNDLSKNELLLLNDLNKSDIVVNPYNLDKSLNYATYDTEPYNIKDVFYAIEAGLTNFEQNMTDEFKFANKIISESGLTLDMVTQYREKIEPITSMTRYSTTEATYSRSIPFMICKELMSMPDNLKIIMDLANKCYVHATQLNVRIVDNPNKEIKDAFVYEALRTFIGNFIESFKTLAGTVYDAFVDRINSLNRHLNALHLPNRVDETAYFGVEEGYDLNSDLNLISFDDTIEMQMESFKLAETEAAKSAIRQYMSKVRGDVFTEQNENGEGGGNTGSSGTGTSSTSTDTTTSSTPPAEGEDTRNNGETQDQTQSSTDTKNNDKDKTDPNEQTKQDDQKGDDNKEGFFKRLMDRIKRALLSYLNKMRDKLDTEFKSKDFMAKYNAVMNDEAIKHLEEMSEGKYNQRILKTAVQGYTGPMYGPNRRSVNGKSHEELQTAVKNFDVNFKNIDASVIMNATEENYRKVILEQFFHKTLAMSNVTVPESIRSDVPMSEVTDFIKEEIYRTWSYGGLNEEEGGSKNEIGRGPETGTPKKKFVTNEVINFLKYCGANKGDTPAGWLPDETTLENTLNKLENSFKNAYGNSNNNNETSDNKEDNNNNENKDNQKSDEEKKRDDLIKKKLEFCGTCFNTAAQAFKDCIIARARDYINVLNRLVPDDIRTRHGGEAEGVNDNDDQENENQNNGNNDQSSEGNSNNGNNENQNSENK